MPACPDADAPAVPGPAASCASSASRWPPSSPRRATRAPTPPSWSRSTTTRCPRVVDPESRARRRAAALPRGAARNVVLRRRAPRARADFVGLRGRRRASASSTSAWRRRPHRGPGRRPPTGTATAGSSTTRRARAPTRSATTLASVYGLEPSAGPGGRARRRRRLRRQGPALPRGGAARLAGPARSAGRCAGSRPAPRTWSALGHGRAQIQHVTIGGDRDGTHQRLPARRGAGRGRLPAASARSCRR